MYKYRYRPGYKSNKLLIEFVSGVESDSFLKDLLTTLEEIDVKVHSIIDLWMNDEIMTKLNSSVGDFTLSKDIWDLGFIMSDNQKVIRIIESLLSKSNLFFKEEVDFKNYM